MSEKLTNIVWENKDDTSAMNLAIDDELIVLSKGDAIVKASSISQLSQESLDSLKQTPEEFARLVFASKN
jgi:hypothetical protein